MSEISQDAMNFDHWNRLGFCHNTEIRLTAPRIRVALSFMINQNASSLNRLTRNNGANFK